MAKKFMFVCVGILALTVAFLLGAQYGRAEYVDHMGAGIIACTQDNAVLLDNGEVWAAQSVEPYSWTQDIYQCPPQIPVPVSNLKFWQGSFFVTNSNELWQYVYSQGNGAWINCGMPPAGPARTQPSTWGGIKAQFK